MGFRFVSVRLYQSLSCSMIAILLALALVVPPGTAQTYVEPYTIQVLPAMTQAYLGESVNVDVAVSDATGTPVSGVQVVMEDSSSGSYYQPGGNQYTDDRGLARYTLSWLNSADVGVRTLRVNCYYGSSNIGTGSATIEVLPAGGTAQSSPFSSLLVVVGAVVGSGLLVAALVVAALALLVAAWLLLRKKPKAEAIELTPGAPDTRADGSSSVTIAIRFRDASGYVAGKTDRIVTLQTTLGSITSPVTVPARASSGAAVLVAGAVDGTAEVTAASGKARGRCQVVFKSLPKRYCMHCGAPLSREASSCGKCGQLPPSGTDAKVCGNCGTVLPEVARFCSRCGACQPGPK